MANATNRIMELSHAYAEGFLSVNGASFFGPVVTPMPQGEAAARLWDGVVLVTGIDGFFELKRTRDRRPSFP